MDENQDEFISWIAAKLEASDEDDLQKKLKGLGDEGIKQAYDQYLQESSVAAKRDGGKLDYIRCLQEFKKGGKMCGCMGGKLNLSKKAGGGSLMQSSGMEGNGPNFEKKKKAKWGKLEPKKVVMGQGMSTITGVTSKQQGGTLPNNKAAAPSKPMKGEQPAQGQPQNQQGGQQGMGPSPEQIQEQKVDEKANSILNKKLGQGDPATSAMDQLKALLKPKQIKAPKEKTLRIFTNNGEYFGVEK